MPTIFELMQQGKLDEQQSSDNSALSFLQKEGKKGESVQVEPVRSAYDVTLGAATYGAAEAGSAVAKTVNRKLDLRSQSLQELSDTLDDFRRRHPEYSPKQVDSAYDLVTDPSALSSRIFAGAPMLAASAGALSIPYVGLPLAAGLSFATSSQSAYEDAIAAHATQEQAERAANISGIVHAMVDTLTASRVLKFTKGQEGWFVRELERKVGKLSRAGNLTADMLGEATMAAGYSAFLGAANEGIANFSYGKEIDPGFLDRRLQDAIGGGAGAVVFGGLGRGAREVFKRNLNADGTETITKLNVYDKDSLSEYLRKDVGMEPRPARDFAEVTDAFARNWAASNDQPVEKFYGDYVLRTGKKQRDVGSAVLQDLNQVPSIFASNDPKEIVGRLTDVALSTMSDAEKALLSKTDPKQAMLEYLSSGKAPSPELVPAFEGMKQTFRDVYLTTKGQNLTIDSAGVLDRLFSTDTDQIREARTKLGEAIQKKEDLLDAKRAGNLAAAAIEPPKSEAAVTEKGIEIKQTPGTLEQQDAVVQNMYDNLRRLQLGRENPNFLSAVERRAGETGTLREVVRHEDVGETIQRGRIAKTMDWMNTALSMADPLKRFKSGRKLLEILDNVHADQNKTVGQFERSNWDAFDRLSREDRAWLKQVDEAEAQRTGLRLSNFQRFIDQIGTPNPILDAPSEGLRLYREQYRNVLQTLGKAFEREGGLIAIREEGGKKRMIPFKQPDQLRMVRVLTDDARAALEARQGPLYDAIKKAVKEGNKDIDLPGVEKALAQIGREAGTSVHSPLSEARLIRYMPTEVQVGGAVKQIFHTDPLNALRQATRVQAYQLAWNRVVGQAGLKSVRRQTIKNLAEQLRVVEPFNINTLKQAFEDKGILVPKEYEEHLGQLKKIAKSLGIDTGPKKKDYLDAIDKLNPEDIDAGREQVIKRFAKEVQGIDLNQHPSLILEDLKQRIKDTPVDSMKNLRDNFVTEGGNLTLFNNMLKMSKGIPIFKSRSTGEYLERNPVFRGVNLLSQSIGALQTSTAVIPNIPQTLVQVPHLAGIRNFLGALSDVVADKRNVTDGLVTLGAIADTHMAWHFERDYVLEGIGRNLKQAVQLGTGMKWISDFNNIVAGQAFRRLADRWKEGNLSERDVQTAKTLRLTDKQIAEIKSGQMSDLTYAKIVQNGVTTTQFVTEAPYRRGFLESHPVMRVLFAYNAYASGTARAMKDFYASTKKLWAGSANDKAAAFYRTSMLVAGSLGAGVLGEMLRNVMRGDVSKEQRDEPSDKFWGALASIQLMGPVQRALDSGKYDQGSIDRYVTGLMPQVRAVADGLAVMMNAVGGTEYGKYGKFPVSEQLKQTAFTHTPLAKAVNRWAENIAYPNEPLYYEIKADVGKWIKKVNPQSSNVGETKLNPDYDNVLRWVIRGDDEQAVKAAMEYYDKYVQKAETDATQNPDQFQFERPSMLKAKQGLRQSLIARSPIHINPVVAGAYLDTLPADKQEKYLNAHAKYMQIVNSVAPAED